jgi:hypothetical protein
VTLVPEVLGQPEATARQLLAQAGLAAEPGRVWRSGPAPGAQSPTASPVRLWVNPPHCPLPTTTS